jgi:UDP-N-acetylglucosamine--N-acetylmuramyl-(pentapeptide) pyrophosphoryl-undecaprenol N-acetylglucosamine transferase
LQGIIEARNILKHETPTLVFSKGGPGSVAVGIAAWTLKIPLYIHESDTVPGFSNRVLSHFATKIFL